MNNGWKRIVITGNADLHKSDNCLLIMNKDEENKIPVNQINSIIIESEQVTITSSLIKIVKNTLYCSNEIKEVSLNSPTDGNIIALPLTINELNKIKTIKGRGIDMRGVTEEVFFY